MAAQAISNTADDFDYDYAEQLRADQNEARLAQRNKSKETGSAGGAVADNAIGEIKSQLKSKILSSIPVVSTLYGSYVFIKKFLSPKNEKKQAKFGLLNMILFLISNLEVFLIVLGVLALLAIIVTFTEAGWVDQAKMILKAIFNLSWGTVQALIDLFKPLKQ
jgi:hypothetical protein